jgi:ABC-2 type transport system ATP-binding protein
MNDARATDVVIDVHGINKHFGENHVVKDLSLTVRRGEIFGFLGPNGSGKTTSIRMLCGLLTPDSGEGTCLGYDIVRETRQIKRHVGYMTQRFSFWEELTLRLALAACLLHEPQLLLLDEPTAGVDPKARRDFWEELHALAARGITVLVSTHYMDEAERCMKLGYILYGRLLVQGTAQEVIASQSLHTWVVTGDDLPALAARLRALPSVEQVAAFGNTLHVTGSDRERLQSELAPLMAEPGRTWIEVEPGLEAVFIHLMRSAGEAPVMEIH